MRIINSIQKKIKRIFANTIPNWVYFLSHTAMNQRALEWVSTAILVYFFKNTSRPRRWKVDVIFNSTIWMLLKFITPHGHFIYFPSNMGKGKKKFIRARALSLLQEIPIGDQWRAHTHATGYNGLYTTSFRVLRLKVIDRDARRL
jgi:hypothetical protein